MQVRCPNCGNYWVTTVYTPIGAGWNTFVTIWTVVWSIIAAFVLLLALIVGHDLSWYVAAWMVAPAIAAVLIGLMPRWVIENRNSMREIRSTRRQCRTCGFQWTL